MRFCSKVSGSGRSVFFCAEIGIAFCAPTFPALPRRKECEEASHSCAEIKSLLDFLRTRRARPSMPIGLSSQLRLNLSVALLSQTALSGVDFLPSADGVQIYSRFPLNSCKTFTASGIRMFKSNLHYFLPGVILHQIIQIAASFRNSTRNNMGFISEMNNGIIVVIITEPRARAQAASYQILPYAAGCRRIFRQTTINLKMFIKKYYFRRSTP